MWVPPEVKDPVLLHEPTRKSVGIFGAVCAGDGRLVVQREQVFNAATFLSFLRRLARHRRPGRRIKLILDNVRYHHAALLRPWLRQHRDIISLDFLPPYSPELNSQERVWKITRHTVTHNQHFPQLEAMAAAVFGQFDLWRSSNETLRRLCAIT